MAEGTYGCADAQADIDTFFAGQKNKADFKKNSRALSRAFAHMRDERDRLKPVTSCTSCWETYQRLRRKYDSD